MSALYNHSKRQSDRENTVNAIQKFPDETATNLSGIPGISSPPRMQVSNLSVRFPIYGRTSHPALKKISFEIAPGEIMGLVGESGSGKTTLARAMMGMIPQPGVHEEGEIRLDGVNISELSESDSRKLRGREISMIVPNPRSELNPLQTIGNQIATVAYQHLGGSWHDVTKRVKDMLAAVGIPDVERRFEAYPHELSGGMAQRVIIAISLICSPRFIISDDATSGLDVTVQAQVLELMNVLVRERHSSMLFITRDIGVAAHFCNRIAVLYAGEIVESADVATFFRRPTHPYSVMLLAAFSHNPTLRKMWTKEIVTEAGSTIAQSGCAFRNRCVRSQLRCEVEAPILRSLSSGSEVRCHFPVEGEI